MKAYKHCKRTAQLLLQDLVLILTIKKFLAMTTNHILKDYNKILKTSNSNPTCIGFMIMLGLESINTTISIILISLHQTKILKFVKWSKIVLIFLCHKLIPIIMLSISSFHSNWNYIIFSLLLPYYYNLIFKQDSVIDDEVLVHGQSKQPIWLMWYWMS